MFELVASQERPDAHRLIATEELTEADFFAIAAALQAPPVRARKTSPVAARRSGVDQRVETRWNGQETINTAAPDDWIVTNLGPDRRVLRDGEGNANTYVIPAARFPALYRRLTGHNAFGDIHEAVAQVRIVRLAGGFEIVAPWGEVQRASSGYLLLSDDGAVYGNHEDTFRATYELLE